MLSGHATPDGTLRYAQRFAALPRHFRSAAELSLPSIGIGTYLGEPDSATDASYTASLEAALGSGINLLDTAINYRHQRSERNIGAALGKRTASAEIHRDEVFVCTKAGYLAFDGAVPPDPRAWIEQQFFSSGVIPQDQRNLFLRAMHCMAPSYLADQLERSRRNLGLETVDLFYLHNPESQLTHIAPDAFLQRIRAAFEFCEQAVASHKIRFYGLATWNGFRVPPGRREYLALQTFASAAREIAGDAHRFRFLQLPFNLAMPQAYAFQNQVWDGEKVSAIEAAARAGVNVVTSATLSQGQLAEGLPGYIAQRLGMSNDAANAIQFARSAPGVTTSLIGMSRPDHVRANLAVAQHPPARMEEWKKLFAK